MQTNALRIGVSFGVMAALTGCSAVDRSDAHDEPRSSSSSSSSSAETVSPAITPSVAHIPPACRRWIEGELTNGIDDTDANWQEGFDACEGLSPDEIGDAIDKIGAEMLEEVDDDVEISASPSTPEYVNGDYLIGTDIPAGTYRSTGAKPDAFDFCSVSTSPSGGGMPKLKTARSGESLIIVLVDADTVVSISGCEPLKPHG